MPGPTDDQIDIYWNLFVNRSDYSRQTAVANASGKHSYFRARKRVSLEPMALTKRQVREHLQGYITLGGIVNLTDVRS